LTAVVSDDEAAALRAILGENPELPLTVDLEQQTIHCGARILRFAIDPVRRTRLLNGWDDIGLTENYRGEIAAFKGADLARRPWARPARA
jgi:3-isopropylmalate/(R)-2-methylmalate dehydratase small subunit